MSAALFLLAAGFAIAICVIVLLVALLVAKNHDEMEQRAKDHAARRARMDRHFNGTTKRTFKLSNGQTVYAFEDDLYEQPPGPFVSSCAYTPEDVWQKIGNEVP